jgi:hypothetical protein
MLWGGHDTQRHGGSSHPALIATLDISVIRRLQDSRRPVVVAEFEHHHACASMALARSSTVKRDLTSRTRSIVSTPSMYRPWVNQSGQVANPIAAADAPSPVSW